MTESKPVRRITLTEPFEYLTRAESGELEARTFGVLELAEFAVAKSPRCNGSVAGVRAGLRILDAVAATREAKSGELVLEVPDWQTLREFLEGPTGLDLGMTLTASGRARLLAAADAITGA